MLTLPHVEKLVLPQNPGHALTIELSLWSSICAFQNLEATASPVQLAKRGRRIWRSKK